MTSLDSTEWPQVGDRAFVINTGGNTGRHRITSTGWVTSVSPNRTQFRVTFGDATVQHTEAYRMSDRRRLGSTFRSTATVHGPDEPAVLRARREEATWLAVASLQGLIKSLASNGILPSGNPERIGPVLRELEVTVAAATAALRDIR